jgi:hypothetical protein
MGSQEQRRIASIGHVVKPLSRLRFELACCISFNGRPASSCEEASVEMAPCIDDTQMRSDSRWKPTSKSRIVLMSHDFCSSPPQRTRGQEVRPLVKKNQMTSSRSHSDAIAARKWNKKQKHETSILRAGADYRAARAAALGPQILGAPPPCMHM